MIGWAPSLDSILYKRFSKMVPLDFRLLFMAKYQNEKKNLNFILGVNRVNERSEYPKPNDEFRRVFRISYFSIFCGFCVVWVLRILRLTLFAIFCVFCDLSFASFEICVFCAFCAFCVFRQFSRLLRIFEFLAFFDFLIFSMTQFFREMKMNQLELPPSTLDT